MSIPVVSELWTDQHGTLPAILHELSVMSDQAAHSYLLDNKADNIGNAYSELATDLWNAAKAAERAGR